MPYKPSLRVAVLFGTIFLISVLHYQTPVTHLVTPTAAARLVRATADQSLWYGWRGGLIAAAIAGLLIVREGCKGNVWGAYEGSTSIAFLRSATASLTFSVGKLRMPRAVKAIP